MPGGAKWYRVSYDDQVWCETSDLEEALAAFEEVKDWYTVKPLRIVFSEWYVPPGPEGHWLDIALVSHGKTVHDHRLTRYAK